jgi:RNase P protein component
MIPRSTKFPMRTEFLRFRTQAKQLATPHLRAFFAPHIPSRFSVIVPAKVSKLASTRAMLRRLIYDEVWPTLSHKNLDYVILLKPLALKKSDSQIILAELKELGV